MKLKQLTVQHHNENGYVSVNKVNESMSIILLLVARRVSLVVSFDFLPQNSGRWWGPTNVILSLYDCRLSGENTQILPAVISTFKRFALTDVGMQKHLALHPPAC